jgi:hypothetical protein
MHWVYVLRSNNGNIYVGETTRLFRRWNEHQTGRGGINTSEDNYDIIIGVYKVSNNATFLEYYEDMVINEKFAYRCQKEWGLYEDKQLALKLENHITKRYFYEKKKNWWSVSGGSYTCEENIEGYCLSDKINNPLIDRPLCNCGFPCEVHMKNDKTKIYFTCPIADWVSEKSYFKVPIKCDFWKEFEPYRKILESWQNKPTARDIFLNNDYS